MGEQIKDILKRGSYKNFAFWLCLSCSIVMMGVSFVLPPIGVISSSSMAASSILWAYGALASFNHALDRGVDAKVKHGETELSIINDEDKKERLDD